MQKNYNENLVAGAAIRDDKGRRISKLFEASHPKMTVGYAKNLIMPDTPTEQEFNFRQAGGGVIEDGVAVIDKVKGNSVVWNQLVKKSTQEETTYNGLTFYPQENGEVLITGVATETSYASMAHFLGYAYESVANHKAFVQIFGDATRTMELYVTDDRQTMTDLGIVQWGTVAAGAVLYIPKGYDCGQGVRLRFIVNDLTQMFGAGNEPSTVEEFLQRKPKVADEFAHNEGTIVNNKVEGCRTVGLNQFNPNVETEHLAVTGKSGSERYVKRFKALPGTYFIKSINNESVYAKSVINGVYGSASALNRNVTITLDSYGEIWVYSETEAKINGVANDICINLSDPAFNGKYFPYEKHELDLSWVKDIKDTEGVKLFEDGMKSAGNAYDEVRKDKAVKRLGSVDLGSLNWVYHTYDGHLYFESVGMAGKIRLAGGTANTLHNILSAKYTNDIWVNIYNNRHDKTIGIYHNDKEIVVYDSAYTDEASFKAAMQGVKLYYELAEPIEVEYDEKNLTYPVIAGGTEEAIASEPSSAFRADIGYGIDAVKTILDLKARVEALEGK